LGRNEIEDLQTRVIQEREKYQAATQGNVSTGFSAIPYFAVNDKVKLPTHQGSTEYILFKSMGII